MGRERELRRELGTLATTTGPDSIEVARLSHQVARTLASAARVAERSDETECLFALAVVIKRRVLPPDDPDIVVTLHDWAVLCQAAGKHERARVLWAAAEVLTAGTRQRCECMT
jgi:hypothetical protein